MTDIGELTTNKIIIATGSASAPKTGSDGNGYELIKKLNHMTNLQVQVLGHTMVGDITLSLTQKVELLMQFVIHQMVMVDQWAQAIIDTQHMLII